LITGHRDGSILIRNMESQEWVRIKFHSSPVTALAVGYSGQLYSWGMDQGLKSWDLKSGQVKEFKTKEGMVSYLKIYPQRRIIALFQEKEIDDKNKKRRPKQKIELIDFNKSNLHVISLPFHLNPSSINVCFDGRIIAGLSYESKRKYNLAVLNPRTETCELQFLEGHGKETRDCLCMGPRIISCGEEGENNHTIRIWGTEFFVRTQVSKLSG
jgi:WD40 repeat protein